MRTSPADPRRQRLRWAGDSLPRLGDQARPVALPGGTRVYLRLAREIDLGRSDAFYAALSPRSRYLRLMQQSVGLPASTLRQLRAQLGDPRACVIVAQDTRAPGAQIVGGARIVPLARHAQCEFALTVIDAWQRRGVGTVLLDELIRAARHLGYRRIEGYALAANHGMVSLARRHRMRIEAMPRDPALVRLSRTLLPRAPMGRVARTNGYTAGPPHPAGRRPDL